VDAGLRVPESAKLFRDADAARTWLLTRRGHAAGRLARRTARGARALLLPARAGHLDLRSGLARLAREGLTDVFVEGGGGLAAALLRAGLVDELHWFVAPGLLGADARPAVAALGVRRLAGRVVLDVREVRRIGPDLYVRAWLGGRA